jgi:hypothetical protein
VTFDNHGTTQELPLANAPDSAPSPSVENPGMAPGVPGGGGNNGPGGFTRFGGGGGGGNNGGMPNSNPGFNGGGPNGANGGMNFGSSTPSQIYQPEASQLTPEAAQLGLAGNHLKAIQDNDPTAPLFPPSAIDSQAGIPDNTDSGNNAAPAP